MTELGISSLAHDVWPLAGDAAPDRGRPGSASLQQPERHAWKSGRDLDLFPVQSANRPRGGSPAGGTEDQMLWYALLLITPDALRQKQRDAITIT